MANIFGDLGQKMQNMATVSKINGAIADEEKRLADAYYQIGKLYYLKHQSDCGEDYSAFAAAITDAEAKIAEYKKQIIILKGNTVCEKCGAEVISGAAFCTVCGTEVKHAVADPNAVICPKCGAPVKGDMKFCTNCGNPMAAPPAGVACANCGAPLENGAAFCTNCGTPAAQNPVSQPAAPAAGKKCPACGAILESDAAFCVVCGAKV